jgi:hypothetical protein
MPDPRQDERLTVDIDPVLHARLNEASRTVKKRSLLSAAIYGLLRLPWPERLEIIAESEEWIRKGAAEIPIKPSAERAEGKASPGGAVGGNRQRAADG